MNEYLRTISMETYKVTSNRESGTGRYDVMLEPYNPQLDDGIILEFKVFDAKKENNWMIRYRQRFCKLLRKDMRLCWKQNVLKIKYGFTDLLFVERKS